MATTLADRALLEKDTELSLPLTARDKLTLGLICFYAFIAVMMEGYWLLNHQQMESRTDLIGRIWSIYWPADYTYRVAGYSIDKSFTLAVESLNVCVLQPLSLLLMYAIVKRRPYRYPLQLLVSMGVFYGTLLYYYIAHLSGYAVFERRTLGNYLTFYLANLPWIVGYLWMIYDAFRHILKRFQSSAAN